MLRRPKLIFVLAVLGTGLILILLPSPLNERIKRGLGWLYLPFIGAAEGIQEINHRASNSILSRADLIAELEQLRNENHRLRIREFQFAPLLQENARLRALAKWKKKHTWDLRLARVVIKEPSNWWRHIALDIGAQEGIGIHDPVLTEKGLVGKVIDVSPASSKVALVGDPRCQVAAELASSGQRGIVMPSGKGLRNRRAELKYLPSKAGIDSGVEVLTSGAGGVFPKGILIGKLIDKNPYELELYWGAQIELAVNMDRLDLVWVIVKPSAKK